MPDYHNSEHLILDSAISSMPCLNSRALKVHGITAVRERFQEAMACLHDPGRVQLPSYMTVRVARLRSINQFLTTLGMPSLFAQWRQRR